MIHLGRSYPYMEEVNDGIVREARRLLPWTGHALDLGCGRGQLGEALTALGWRVWGVDASAEACAVARTRLDRVIEADLVDRERVSSALGGARFDAVVLSDVLEHVYDPGRVLEGYLELLKPGGRLFVSVPNAVAWTNRLSWMIGNVRYQDTGLMDRTHIRFFTFSTTRELVEASGCEVERVSSTPYLARAVLPALKRALARGNGASPDPRAIIDSPAYKAYMRIVYPVESALAAAWPAMMAFRIIVVARKGA